MAEVSTSHGAVFSRDGKERRTSFDLRSWQGLTQVLKMARESGLSPESYSEFRNLVLQYAQHGGDAELRKQVEQAIQRISQKTPSRTPAQDDGRPKHESPKETQKVVFEPESASTPKVTLPLPEKPTRRPIPSFLPKHVTHEEDSSLVPESVPVTEKVVTVVEPEPKSNQDVVQNEQPEPVVVDLPPTPVIPQAPEPVPQQEPAQHETVVAYDSEPEVPHHEASVVHDVPAVEVETRSCKSPEECKARIAEIKHIVNSQVGNPVALIDAGNHIGRTYMSALLTAMKTVGSGAPGIESAMQKLEEAFVEIETFVQTTQQKAPVIADPVPVPPEAVLEPVPASEPVRTPEPEPVPAPEPVPMPEPVLVPEPTPVPEPVLEPEAEEEIIARVDTSAPEEVIPPPVSVVDEVVSPIPEMEEEVLVTKPEVAKEPDEVTMEDSKEEGIVAEETPTEVEPHPEVIEHVPPESVVSPDEPEVPAAPFETHEEELLPSILELKEENVTTGSIGEEEDSTSTSFRDEIAPDTTFGTNDLDPTVEQGSVPIEQVAVRQSELASAEVTVALNQLLSEWSIFAGSGLFGIGPSGAEHPLYQTLSSLSMGEVIAGRWEHANNHLTRTIKDYIDAWRHEQGIAYNPSETFEHYLRRVVQRILKRQGGSSAS